MVRIKELVAVIIRGFIGTLAMPIFIEILAEQLDIPHAIVPKSRLARFFYVSEIARVPILLCIAIILSPLAIGDKVRARFRRTRE